MATYTCTSGMSRAQHRQQKSKVAAAYSAWLGTIHWDFYCTFTTPYKLSVRSARRLMERQYNLLKTRFPDLSMFWAAEPFDTGESYHTHALIGFNGNQSATAGDIKSVWQVVSGGKGKKEYHQTIVLPYQKDKGANFYVAKYILRPNADYEMM